MRYWFIRISLLVCLATPFAGQTNEWRRYKNDGGNFSVLMPAEPQESAGTGKQDEAPPHTIQAVSASVAYTLVYVANTTEQRVDDATFQIYRDAFLKGLPQCNLVREEPVSHPLAGYIGRWYRMNCDVGSQKVSFIGNLYWGKHYGYAVLVMFETATSDPPAAKTFIDSFAVIDPGK